MIKWLNDSIYAQPVLVFLTSETSTSSDVGTAEITGNFIKSDPTVPALPTVVADSSQVLKTAFSSIPFLWKPELQREYQDLGEALEQMTELDDDSQEKIEPPVFGAACFVAAGLMGGSYPAPRVFNHGPKSIVFNWAHEKSNLYLTISADKVSALVSTPERIQKRVDFSGTGVLDPAQMLAAIHSTWLNEPAPLLLTGTVPDLSDVIG
jgi:hypothetical protein